MTIAPLTCKSPTLDVILAAKRDGRRWLRINPDTPPRPTEAAETGAVELLRIFREHDVSLNTRTHLIDLYIEIFTTSATKATQ